VRYGTCRSVLFTDNFAQWALTESGQNPKTILVRIAQSKNAAPGDQ
jgi:hypothetical protein